MAFKLTHNYDNYEDYINFQLIKTSDKNKQKKWLTDEWRLKIDIFKNIFSNNLNIINKCSNALCLGSRTGQEVVALQELGVKNVIGIDLHEFKPYTIKGDIHNLDFNDEIFDLEFSNIFDHSLYPDKFISEVYRTLKKNGYFILHIQIDINQDKYTEIIINNIDNLINIIKEKGFNLVSSQKIDSGIIAMNHELIFYKN
jgi:SAM-dependent methyltransferase